MGNTSINYNYDKYKGEWQPLTHYAQYDLVHFNDVLWIADATFVTGAVFDEFNWTCHSCADDPYPYPVNPEQGFNPASPNVGSHTISGANNEIIENATGSFFNNRCVDSKSNHINNTYRCLYFEYEVLSGSPTCGLGSNSNSARVGFDKSNNSLGYDTGTGGVYRKGLAIASGNPVPVGGVVRIWMRYYRVWVGSYSSLYGYEIIGGGDPYINESPTETGLPQSYAISTCYSPGDKVRINTVGNFLYPPLPNAHPWDS